MLPRKIDLNVPTKQLRDRRAVTFDELFALSMELNKRSRKWAIGRNRYDRRMKRQRESATTAKTGKD